MQLEGIESEATLEDTIKRLESALKRARKNDAVTDDPTEEPSYPLLEIHDDEVSPLYSSVSYICK